MFEEHIAHGNDMIRRLEKERGLSEKGIDALPAHQRVPIAEAEAWHASVNRRIRESFGPDTLARFELISKLHSNEIKDRIGDERSRIITFWRRVLDLLTELQNRVDGNRLTGFAPLQNAPSGQGVGSSHTIGPVTRYDIFLSHASEDKESIARPLYNALVEAGVTVWFDEAALELGDSLRRKIDQGLARCRYGVVILSPSFLQKQWPQRELDGLTARETQDGEKAILPIWHNLDAAALMQHSPTLADRLAARSDQGMQLIVSQVLKVLKR
jgi:hypothetical protein